MRQRASVLVALLCAALAGAQERVIETNGVHYFPDGIEVGGVGVIGASSTPAAPAYSASATWRSTCDVRSAPTPTNSLAIYPIFRTHLSESMT